MPDVPRPRLMAGSRAMVGSKAGQLPKAAAQVAAVSAS